MSAECLFVHFPLLLNFEFEVFTSPRLPFLFLSSSNMRRFQCFSAQQLHQVKPCPRFFNIPPTPPYCTEKMKHTRKRSALFIIPKEELSTEKESTISVEASFANPVRKASDKRLIESCDKLFGLKMVWNSCWAKL